MSRSQAEVTQATPFAESKAKGVACDMDNIVHVLHYPCLRDPSRSARGPGLGGQPAMVPPDHAARLFCTTLDSTIELCMGDSTKGKLPKSKAKFTYTSVVCKNFKLSLVVKHGFLAQTNHTEDTQHIHQSITKKKKNYQTTYMTMTKNKFATPVFKKG